MTVATEPEPPWVARLEAKLDRLLEGKRPAVPRRVDRQRLARILPAVAGVIGSVPFAVRDLFDEDASALRIVLTGLTTKSLAQLLSRGVAQVIEGYVVERSHRELNAQCWRVLKASPAQGLPPGQRATAPNSGRR